MSGGTMAASAFLNNVGRHLDAYREYSQAEKVIDSGSRAEQQQQMARLVTYLIQQGMFDEWLKGISPTVLHDPERTGETARRDRSTAAAGTALRAGGDGVTPSTVARSIRRTNRAADAEAKRFGWDQAAREFGYSTGEYARQSREHLADSADLIRALNAKNMAGMQVDATHLGHTAAISDGLRMISDIVGMYGAMSGGSGGGGGASAGAGVGASAGAAGGASGAAAGAGAAGGASGAAAGAGAGAGAGAVSGAAPVASSMPSGGAGGGSFDWNQLLKLFGGNAGQYSGGHGY